MMNVLKIASIFRKMLRRNPYLGGVLFQFTKAVVLNPNVPWSSTEATFKLGYELWF
jgi:hypothetical protein